MDPARWQRVKAALNDALDRTATERLRWLESLALQDAALAEDVRRLLRNDEQAQGFLSTPARLPETLAATGEHERTPSLAGRRIGPYRVVAEVGRGGMGTVYRAVREEDGKQVAIKLLLGAAGLSSPARQRFKAERHILAALEHENIARLIDGGHTEEGWPYFTLDYVEGRPITTYCQERGLGVAARVLLFERVCAAVQYAHQRLVVHRDLKPGNILVTTDGVPKLLDFGIAKLLAGGADDPAETPTLTIVSALTPHYASPEQVRGGAITVATDVYALGLLLYELLAERRAQDLRTAAPDELLRVVCEADPPPPSDVAPAAWRRELRGDLDAIVMRALRKEPERRYASVQDLALDVRRRLEGRPVAAHGGAWTYRAGKFVRRHRGAALAAGLVLVTLLGGVLATLRQARLAEAQRALAQGRYEDVRRLATTFLFEFHDAIRDLPGATPARKLVVAKALEYLDRLAQQPGDDAALLRELSNAYQRVGDVQGSPYNSNLGDLKGARASYGKAVALAQRLVSAEPGDVLAGQTLARAVEGRGTIEMALGEIEAAFASLRGALQLYEQLGARAPADRELRRGMHIVHVRLGDLHKQRGEWARAREQYESALYVAERIAAEHGPERLARRDVGVALSRLTDVQARDDPRGALATARRLVELDAQAPAAERESAEYQRDVAVDYEDLAQKLALVGQQEEALAYQRRALAIRERLLAADPQNEQALQDVSVSHSQIGDVLAARGRRREALESYLRSLEIDARIAASNPLSRRAQDYLGSSHANVGSTLLALGRPREALDHFERALPLIQALAAADPSDLNQRGWLADILVHTADARAALARGAGSDPSHARQARVLLQQSAEIYGALRAAGALDDAGRAKADAVARRLGRLP